MKYLIIVFTLVFASCNNSKQSKRHKAEPYDDKAFARKNRIKSCFEYSICFPNKAIKKRNFCQYDKDGSPIDDIDYQLDSLGQRHIYTYDGAGKKIRVVEYSSKNPPDTTDYLYDSLGGYTAKSFHEVENYNNKGEILNSADDLTKTEYKYDKSGNLIEESMSGNMLSDGHKYVYDSTGNMIEETWRFCNVECGYGKIIYKYDDAGNEIERNSFQAYEPDKLKLDLRIIESYDSENNLIRTVGFDSASKMKYKTIYKYNANNSSDCSMYYNNKGELAEMNVWIYRYYTE